MVPVMTMHQVEGLQFPFMFVGHMGEDPAVSVSHQLETRLSQFPTNPARAFARLPRAMRAELDMIRRYYVAYSRAQWALILMGTNAQFKTGSTALRAERGMAAESRTAAVEEQMATWDNSRRSKFRANPASAVRPRFSLTSDILSYRRCSKTVRLLRQRWLRAGAGHTDLLRNDHSPGARSVPSPLLGNDGPPTETMPTDADIDSYFGEVQNALRSHGVRPASPAVAEKALRVLQLFNRIEGPTLYPLDPRHRVPPGERAEPVRPSRGCRRPGRSAKAPR